MSIWDKLTDSSQFTATELAIIDYLQDQRYTLYQVTIGQLAKETYSSNASVIRLCQKLGFQGFRDFRLALALDLEAQRHLDKTVDYSKPVAMEDAVEDVVSNLFSLYKNSLEQIQSHLNLTELEQVADLIFHSSRLFLFGYGDVKITLSSFMNKVNKIGFFPFLATENDEDYLIVNHLTSEDVAFFISYSGTNERMLNRMQQLQAVGTAIILITANAQSPLLPYCQQQMIIPDLEKTEKMATFYSQLSFEYILNLLYILIYQKWINQL